VRCVAQEGSKLSKLLKSLPRMGAGESRPQQHHSTSSHRPQRRPPGSTGALPVPYPQQGPHPCTLLRALPNPAGARALPSIQFREKYGFHPRPVHVAAGGTVLYSAVQCSVQYSTLQCSAVPVQYSEVSS